MSREKPPRCQMKISLCTSDHRVRGSTSIEGSHLIQKFYQALIDIGDEDTADIIMAHEQNVLLWSYMEKYVPNNFMEFVVLIREVEANTFTMKRIGGVTGNNPVEVIETDFILRNHQEAVVFDASEMFLNNFVTSFNKTSYELNNNLMCTLVRNDKPETLRTLLDRNESMERTNEPMPFQLACLHGREEIVALFMYYNVTPHVPAVQYKGSTIYRHPAIYYATDNDHEDIIEMLIDYTFDKWSDFDVDFLLQLMFNGSPNLDRVARILHEHADTMTSFFASRSLIDEIWTRLFTVRKYYLKRGLGFLRKYRHVFDRLMEGFRREHWYSYWTGPNIRSEIDRKIFFENLHCLGEAFCEEADEPKPTLLQEMMDKLHLKWPLRYVMRACTLQWIPYAEIEPIVLLLLANNATLDSYSFDYIFRCTMISERGESVLFDACRYVEVDCTKELSLGLYGDYEGPLASSRASSYYHQFPRVRTMMDVLKNPANIYRIDIVYYVKMSSHPNVKNKVMELADSRNEPEMRTLLDNLPDFPKLLEFARDAARKYVVERYNVKTSLQFYEAVKKLEICEYLKKIIAYDLNTPLYNKTISAGYP